MAFELPPTFLLPTHMEPEELHRLEDKIPNLTYDIQEAEIVVGKVTKRERAMFELRRAKLETEPLDIGHSLRSRSTNAQSTHDEEGHESKRRRTAGQEVPTSDLNEQNESGPVAKVPGTVMVLQLAWLTESIRQGVALPIDGYLLYKGRKIPRHAGANNQTTFIPPPTPRSSGADILRRAAEEQEHQPPASHRSGSKHGFGQPHYPPPLVQQTTSDHDVPLPPLPEFLHTTYSCQRPTPVDPPNSSFVEKLKKVRTLRILHGDQIGVRAYSTSIATLAAYPHPLQGPQDVARLPGCGAKIAVLYQQWLDTGELDEVRTASADPKLVVLQVFYEIWGVGDTTARAFYNKDYGAYSCAGWRDLDDLVEYGWGSLSRVQQIGVKYYDEFLLKIPRREVEDIAGVVLDHARQVDKGFQMVIVGGYRRGKSQSGDVDVILSHPDETKTLHLIEQVVVGLEKSNFITHTLSLSTRNSERGQLPLAWKGEGRKAGSGFDTLDKALVVWQSRTGTDTAVKGESTKKDDDKEQHQPVRPHRRVDIIVSPWKTVGCAVLGWSGGTTFQRDLRRYCKQEKGLKFDSSGIRTRADGSWVDLEGEEGDWPEPAPDMETAERRVFAGLGLEYRRPEERCTG